jgi:hypothetical protein
MLGLLRELADRHVLYHAPTQWAHRLFSHEDAPVLSEGCEPLIKTGRTHPPSYELRPSGSAPTMVRAKPVY